MVTFWLKDPRHYSISTPAEEEIPTTASTIHLITLKHTKQAANLDNCLLTLADGHDHVMKAMIGELRDIVDSGYVQTFPHILAFGKLSMKPTGKGE